MGVTWALGWAIFGVTIGVASNIFPGRLWEAFFRVFDAPLPALAIPGFIGGMIFSVILRIAGRARRFDQLSIPRFAAWGSLGGLLLALVPAVLVGTDLASANVSILAFTAAISAPLVLLCAGSAAGSLAIARKGARRELLEDRDNLDELPSKGPSRRIRRVG